MKPLNVSCATLPNGLRLIHHFDGDSTQVAVALLYGVGARDEHPEKTGLAHLLEHLMFTGSVNAPNFDKALQAAGGQNNAWTSNDFTCFHDVVPAMNVETALWLESDRMTGLNLDKEPFEVQRKVVVEEFYQQCINRPYGRTGHLVRSLAFERHPYRWPVIGMTPMQVGELKVDDARDFYTKYYAPNNAVLAISGNITFEKARELTLKWFGDIASSPMAPRSYKLEEPLRADKEGEMTDNVSNTMISLNFPMERYGTEWYYTADLITDILSSGRSSVLYRNLVEGTNLFDAVDASIYGSEDPGLLTVTGVLRSGADEHEAKERLEHELKEFASGQVETEKLERTLTRMESGKVFDNLGQLARVQEMAVACYHGEPAGVNMEPYRDLTPQKIAAEARRLFIDGRHVTAVVRPNN